MNEGWIDITQELPKQGECIEGRNKYGETWEEEWESTEPIGIMTHWRKIKEV